MSNSITALRVTGFNLTFLDSEHGSRNKLPLFIKIVIQASLLLLPLILEPTVQAQTCENIPNNGGQSISASISINGTNSEVTNGMVVAPYTQLRIDSVASAFGNCTGMAWFCNNGCTCSPTGYVYERNINHTNVWVDVSTNTALNGAYTVGYVWGSQSDQHVLDTRSSESTGPNYYTPP